jgi:hypothetical protein
MHYTVANSETVNIDQSMCYKKLAATPQTEKWRKLKGRVLYTKAICKVHGLSYYSKLELCGDAVMVSFLK